MAIYLVDYENVYIEGLEGLEQLGKEDTLHIFYTQNRCGLTFDLYQKLTHCDAQVQLNEVSVSLKNGDPVKNALDIQLMMFTGYLIGSRQTDHLYIVSKDKDFWLGTEFFHRFIQDDSIELRIIPSISASFEPKEEPAPAADAQVMATLESLAAASDYPEFIEAVERQLDDGLTGFAALCNQYASPTVVLPEIPVTEEPEESTPMFTVQYHNTVRNLLGKNTDEDTVNRVCEIISGSENLVDLNNGLAKLYRDGERAKTAYHKFKPKFEDLRHLSRVRNKG